MVDPPVLFGSGADRLLEASIVPLGDGDDGVGAIFARRIGDSEDRHFEVQWLVFADIRADHHGRAARESKESQGFVARGHLAEEFDPAAFGSSVLVGKQRQSASLGQERLDLARRAGLGKHELPA